MQVLSPTAAFAAAPVTEVATAGAELTKNLIESGGTPGAAVPGGWLAQVADLVTRRNRTSTEEHSVDKTDQCCSYGGASPGL